MESSGSRVLVTGGTGFVGSAIVRALGSRPMRLLMRDDSQRHTAADADIEYVTGDVTDPASLQGAMDGCDAVIHLVAIIEEEGDATFDRVIRAGTANIVAAAVAAGVPRLLHMSALGTRNDPRYGYFLAKYRAEQAVRQSSLNWTIFRPSIIFGPGDGFIRILADLVRSAPVIPVAGDGKSKFQPIAVEQVAAAFTNALDEPATHGQTYDLGGGKIYTYEELLDLVARTLKKRKPKIHVPVALIRPVVALTKPLPEKLRPPVTGEQLKMLAIDNCTDASATETLTGEPAIRLEDAIDYIRQEAKSAATDSRRPAD